MSHEFYSVLGVARNASQEEIKTAYKKLAKTCHPDLNPNDKGAEERFKKLSEAYQILGDPEKRKEYDLAEENPFRSGFQEQGGPRYRHTQSGDSSRYQEMFRNQFGEGFDFSDLFGSASHRHSGPMPSFKGQDHIFVMEIDFEESVLGAEKLFETPDGKIQTKVPPGIRSGQRLRFPGKGGKGVNGGPSGDLYVEIEVHPSLVYTRTGNDLEVEIPVLFSKAILGGKIAVPSVDGQVELELPKLTSSGTKLRIKGKGVRKKGNPGDLYARIKVTMPKEVAPELEKAIKAWHEKFGKSVS